MRDTTRRTVLRERVRDGAIYLILSVCRSPSETRQDDRRIEARLVGNGSVPPRIGPVAKTGLRFGCRDHPGFRSGMRLSVGDGMRSRCLRRGHGLPGRWGYSIFVLCQAQGLFRELEISQYGWVAAVRLYLPLLMAAWRTTRNQLCGHVKGEDICMVAQAEGRSADRNRHDIRVCSIYTSQWSRVTAGSANMVAPVGLDGTGQLSGA